MDARATSRLRSNDVDGTRTIRTPLRTSRRGASGASLGLIGMEERIALAGGSFELRAAPGQGTVLLATFPLRRQGSEQAA